MENYKIIGGDGVEYGPVTLDELRDWIRDGRVGKDTLIWRKDVGTWTAAARYTELEEALRKLYGAAGQSGGPIRLAGFGRRAAGYILDQVFFGFLLLLLWPLASKALHLPAIPENHFANLDELISEAEKWTASIAVFLYPAHFLFHALFNGAWGATPGKLIMGIRIVRLDGSRIGYGVAILRWIGQRLSEFPLGLGYFFVLCRPDKRALHDLIANTQVVFKP